MGFGKAVKRRFALIRETPIRILALALAIVVSLCFGLVTVIAFSTIPDAVKDFPVAIVNDDAGAELDGEEVNYGDDIIDEIRNNDSVKWEICDADKLKDGIENTDYYFAFVIPEDFSERVVSAKTGEPETADIQYLSNMRKNFIASQLTRSIRSEFEDMVSQSVTEEYAKGAFSALGEAADGFGEVAEGSETLEAGLAAFAGGMGALDDGASRMESGAAVLETGAGKLSAGMDELDRAVSGMDIGQIELSGEQSSKIYDAAAGSQEVSAASEQLSRGVASAVCEKIKSGMASQDMRDAMTSRILAGLEQSGYGQALSSLSEEQKEALVGTIVSSALDGASSGITEESIYEGIKEPAQAGLSEVAGRSALSGAQGVLQQVNGELSAGAENMTRLKTSVSQLAKGSVGLYAGAGQLRNGARELDDGISDMEAGQDRLLAGAGSLSSGLEEGENRIRTELVNSDEEMGAFVADPVDVSEHVFGELTKYSEGFMPLFMSLGIWIGSLILLFIIPLRRSGDSELSSPSIVFSGYLTMTLFSVLESVLIVTGILVIGIEPVSVPQMYLIGAVAALSFSAILQSFNLAFGMGGNIIGVMCTIFMIPSCGGSFPVDLMPGFYLKISPFLPMTYSIDGIREALSGGDMSVLIGDCGHLFIFLAVFMCISLMICRPSTKRVEYITEQINRI